MSVHVIEAKFLLLEVCTTTLSPSIWHMKSLHFTEAKFQLQKVYYYIESQYLTPWCQYTWLRQSFYCWRSVLLHWVPVSDNWSKYLSLRPSAKGQYNYIVSKYLTDEVSTHHWGQGSTARGQYYYIESQYLTPWCQNTWLRQSFYCWRSVLLHWVPVSDNWSKYLSLRPSSTARGQYNYIESKYLKHEFSTHHWGQVSTARGQYYYIESLYDVSTHHWGQGSTARGQF